jgi:hypothetical protein
MMTGLMQQRENQRIFADEGMVCEPTIDTNKTGAAAAKRLRIH